MPIYPRVDEEIPPPKKITISDTRTHLFLPTPPYP
jgi:hypothetical protein